MEKDGRIAWWREARFGMFIHWGIYTVLAGEYEGRRTDHIAEWIMHDLKIPVAEYERLAPRFNPRNFNAREIARLAKDTGMRYITFTAKHHDGFAMYHSKCSPYNIIDATPFGRDPVRELADACAAEGLRLCLYYSQAQDWHHPDGYEADVPSEGKDFRRYLDEKCVPQLRELLTGYGDIGMIWFDTPMGMTEAQSRELIEVVRALQPDCLVSGRIGNQLGDYMTTGDNCIPLLPYEGDWEVPATINGTWGYNPHDTQWKPAGELLRNLVRVVSRGGNYLLNIGPDALGNVPAESVELLAQLGAYTRANGEAIYGTRATPIYPYEIDWGYFTCRDGCLYIHILDEQPKLRLLNIDSVPRRAIRLSDGAEMTVKVGRTCEGDGSWEIAAPDRAPFAAGTVLRVELKEDMPRFTQLK
ncbi:alpha-L-fucosidase [Eubacteriales bacterium OttesenSCG-928-A19]|nr:alpha-L-fucosidase [Eubacteriales bacterium OttesenSCG-928-A19]